MAIVPFTLDSETVTIHFCPEAEINGYLLCNGKGCVLCRVGRKQEPRILLPVYLPASGVVGILPLSMSCRPNSLLPQLGTVLEAGKPMVAFISYVYRVQSIRPMSALINPGA